MDNTTVLNEMFHGARQVQFVGRFRVRAGFFITHGRLPFLNAAMDKATS
jgi:hypothetical protein